MFDPLAVVAIVCLYVGGLFLVALWVERSSSRGKRLARSPVIYSLALAVYCTSWTFYGSVGSAASSGTVFLAIYLGTTLSVTLWWLVLRKLVRIKTAQRITSLADLISARYGKAQSLAALATVIALVGTTPYIALQLKSVTTTFSLMTGGGSAWSTWIQNNVDLVVVVLMIIFTILFGVRRLDPTERHEGVVTALAAESAVKLVAFLVVGVFVTFFLYNGFDDIFQSLPQSAELAGIAGRDVTTYLTWMTYLLLSMSAVLFLPRQFHIAVVENSDEKHIRTAVWLFPLYMLLINVFVIPVAMAGLQQGYPVNEADTFVLGLPLRHGQPWLALLVFIGGFSAATGMIVVSAMTTSTMVSNHLLLPLVESVRGLGPLRRQLLRARWVAVAIIMLLGYAFARLIGESYTLVNMGLISFAAVLQFAPSILGGLFWRRGNKRGALLGLSAGFALWAYTLFIPSFAKSGWLPTGWIENGPLGLGFLRPEQLFGVAGLPPLTHTVFWSMLLNVGLYVLGSLYFEAEEEEQESADAFVDALALGGPARRLIFGEAHIPLAERAELIGNLLNRYFARQEAMAFLGRCLDAVGIRDQEFVSVAGLVELQSEVERSLAGSIGSAAARQAVSQLGLLSDEEAAALSEMYGDILADLRVSPEELRQRIDYYRERDTLLARQATELEERVARRTRALQTAADVGRAASTILEPKQLIRESVDLIRERFDLYYVGLFLLDESRQWAILQAGTGEAGQAMLSRGHSIQVGEGMVGWAIDHGTWRVASDVGEDAVRLATEELPLTRAEAALPLRSRGEALGALTVQATRPGALDPQALTALQTMADQVAVAIDNARLYAQSQRALEAERQAIGEISREAWLRMMRTRPDWGYQSDSRGISPSSGAWQPEMTQALTQAKAIVTRNGDESTAALPLRIRGQVIGVLDFSKTGEDSTWSNDEIELLETLAEQLAVALESARLHQDTQRREARERLIGQVSTRIRETLDMDAVLRTATREIGEALSVAEVEVRLAEPAQAQAPTSPADGDNNSAGGTT